MPDYYVKDDTGNYTIAEHPDTARIKEFRQSNIELTKKLAAYDPEAAKTVAAKVAAGEWEDVGALKLALATAEEKVATAQAEAAALARRHLVSAAFLAAGGQPEAVDLVVMKTAGIEEDKLTDWLADAAMSKELGFAFRPSTGGGAKSSPRLGVSTANELRDPTPQQLGQYAKDIASGKRTVVYSNQ